MAENKKSKSTERSARTTHRGHREGDKIVRRGGTQRPLSQRVTTNTGLLDQLAISAHAHTQPSPEIIREQLIANFTQKFGEKVVALTKTWPLATRLLVLPYVKSLISGDGSAPKGLSEDAIKIVHASFVRLCRQMVVGHDTLPGQQTERYRDELATIIARDARRAASRIKPVAA